MKKIILILMALTLFACAPQGYYERPEPQVREEPQKQEMVFSSDPLLDGYYRSQYLEMLRRCGSGRDRCRKD